MVHSHFCLKSHESIMQDNWNSKYELVQIFSVLRVCFVLLYKKIFTNIWENVGELKQNICFNFQSHT